MDVLKIAGTDQVSFGPVPVLMVVKIIWSTVLDPYIAEVQIICQSNSGPKVIKLFLCSTQLSMKFQLFIKTKIPTNEKSFLL